MVVVVQCGGGGNKTHGRVGWFFGSWRTGANIFIIIILLIFFSVRRPRPLLLHFFSRAKKNIYIYNNIITIKHIYLSIRTAAPHFSRHSFTCRAKKTSAGTEKSRSLTVPVSSPGRSVFIHPWNGYNNYYPGVWCDFGGVRGEIGNRGRETPPHPAIYYFAYIYTHTHTHTCSYDLYDEPLYTYLLLRQKYRQQVGIYVCVCASK